MPDLNTSILVNGQSTRWVSLNHAGWRRKTGYKALAAQRAHPAESTQCECGWPDTDCAEEFDLVEDCPRWKGSR